jgi:MFS family permease
MRKPSVLVIFLTVFIDLIGFGIVIPILPLYGKLYGANGFMVGLIIASFSVMQFIFSPIWGRLSDRIGRRPVLLMSLAGGAAAYGIFTLASVMEGSAGLWLMLASRSFAGICGGNINVAQAYIADITPPEQRSAKMGLIGVAFGLGFIVGPLLGVLSIPFGHAAPGLVATALCTANLMLAYFILPESWKPTSEHVIVRPRFGQWMHTLKQPQIGLLILLFFLATFCFACWETTLALFLQQTLHYDMRHVSALFAFSGVISAFIQGGMIKRLVKSLGESRLIIFSFIVMGISFVIMPLCGSLPMVLFAVALLSIGTSTNRPPTFGLLSILTPSAEQGANLGIAQSAGSLSRIVGPLFAGALFDAHPAMPYYICGVIAMFAGGVGWFWLQKEPVMAKR